MTIYDDTGKTTQNTIGPFAGYRASIYAKHLLICQLTTHT